MRYFGPNWLKPGVVTWLQRQAAAGRASMLHPKGNLSYFHSCTAFHCPSGTKLILSRDTEHHACGWWKNPDYERCLHLSLSFYDPETMQPTGRNTKLSTEWVGLVFQDYCRLLWCEPPYSPEGKKHDVWHYRLFYADPGFTAPILPRGEVYSKEFTEAGWKSWSDVQAETTSALLRP